MAHLFRYLFFILFLKPFLFLFIGMNVRHRERLPTRGPLVVTANHNSHLDAWVLMNLFSLSRLWKIRPVAAADYFMKNRFTAWISLTLIGIVPISRTVSGAVRDPLKACCQELEDGQILIFFPEGTRGEPEQRSTLRSGIAHLSRRYPEIPVVPIFLHGTGKALPRRSLLLVPFNCDVFIGDPLTWNGDRDQFMKSLESALQTLSEEHHLCTEKEGKDDAFE